MLFKFLFSFFFSDVFAILSNNFSSNWGDANEGKKQRQQNTNKRRRSRRAEAEGGSDAGVQVSAATQRTCTSNYGTDVCITSSPRHDGVMADARGKGCVKKKHATAIMKTILWRGWQ